MATDTATTPRSREPIACQAGPCCRVRRKTPDAEAPPVNSHVRSPRNGFEHHFSADYTIAMFGFDFRQRHPPWVMLSTKGSISITPTADHVERPAAPKWSAAQVDAMEIATNRTANTASAAELGRVARLYSHPYLRRRT